jgi:hypothetical protein
MWGFLALANSIFERCDDSSGTVIGIFHSAANDLGELAKAANADPKKLADHTFQALTENNYGQFDYLISALRPALGEEGLEHLKQRMIALSKEPVKKLPEEERRKIGWSSSGPIYEDGVANRHRASVIHLALKEIADARGDVDSFIAQYDSQTRKVPRIAAHIARRLLAAGRTEEALQTIEATEHTRTGWLDFEWEDARINVLDALGRSDDAQAVRWSCFERSLSPTHLRAYLKRLPDFDDIEAENRALDYAEKCYVYVWADGVYLQARMEPQAECMLVLIGATPEGKKELLGFRAGMRESAQSWKELLVDLKARGLSIAPEIAVGDGALGFWRALDEAFPSTRHQRCWRHKTLNVLDKLPKSAQPAAHDDLREIWLSPNRAADFAIATFAEKYAPKYDKAVDCPLKDRDVLLTFFDFPAEHWTHLRTSNPIESAFATVRHRTVRMKGALSQDTARLMVFKLVMAASKSWRRPQGQNQLPKVVSGVTFRDGIEVASENKSAA